MLPETGNVDKRKKKLTEKIHLYYHNLRCHRNCGYWLHIRQYLGIFQQGGGFRVLLRSRGHSRNEPQFLCYGKRRAE